MAITVRIGMKGIRMRTVSSPSILVSGIVFFCMLMPLGGVAQDARDAEGPDSTAMVDLEIRRELDKLRRCAKHCENQIRRIELLLDLDRVVRDRDETLDRWRREYGKRDTSEYSIQNESQLRGHYFKTRADIHLIHAQLDELKD